LPASCAVKFEGHAIVGIWNTPWSARQRKVTVPPEQTMIGPKRWTSHW
jgi:hypothetical protein